jgi:FAD/FMN-containing dehydrogenase
MSSGEASAAAAFRIALQEHEKRQLRVQERMRATSGQVRVSKGTASNLFRYRPRHNPVATGLRLDELRHVLSLDDETATLEVEGLATYETAVGETLARGLLPTVAPELKHITVGGALVGIGIESTCHRYGFAHDGLLEASVLLPYGEVVVARPDNEHADLFRALPNSYGTLGYILRAKIRLHRAAPQVEIQNIRYSSVAAYLDAMKGAVEAGEHDFVEGLFYRRDECYLTLGRMVASEAEVEDIYRRQIYYRLLRGGRSFHLDTLDYIFRYDPDWFWNLPETALYKLFRRYAPLGMRNSGFYRRYMLAKDRTMSRLRLQRRSTERLIQDWQVPWDRAGELIELALHTVDLEERPWVALPIVPQSSPTLYPVKAGTLYFNLGCYCPVRRAADREEFYYTKTLDARCFELDGIKMLYSSTFLDRESFDGVYNGGAYAELKRKYDPSGRMPTLFEKAVRSR